ncbi:hypothetical protein B0H16DRAFT_1703130 [Mycena metata]|uniref:Uncharacterized protein n=1 Tax=Mycena metata TaxID=1033252 RepID=A0AAD7H4H4_9AGAR|nr:hypothetical protein B0H16DRAFT_1703130 [Mycena metata]
MSSQFAIRRQDLAAATAPFEVLFLAMPSDLSGPRIFGLIDRKCQLYRRQIIDLPLVALNEQKSQIPRVAQLLAYQRFGLLGDVKVVREDTCRLLLCPGPGGASLILQATPWLVPVRFRFEPTSEPNLASTSPPLPASLVPPRRNGLWDMCKTCGPQIVWFFRHLGDNRRGSAKLSMTRPPYFSPRGTPDFISLRPARCESSTFAVFGAHIVRTNKHNSNPFTRQIICARSFIFKIRPAHTASTVPAPYFKAWALRGTLRRNTTADSKTNDTVGFCFRLWFPSANSGNFYDGRFPALIAVGSTWQKPNKWGGWSKERYGLREVGVLSKIHHDCSKALTAFQWWQLGGNSENLKDFERNELIYSPS